MYEKVNPKHPDKIADRIAGMIVDIAYTKKLNPKVAVEVLIGHNECYIIIESDYNYQRPIIINYIKRRVKEISGALGIKTIIKYYPQDAILNKAQEKNIVCADNGIFKGVPITSEQRELTDIAERLYKRFNADGKYILNDDTLIACQSNAKKDDIENFLYNMGVEYDLDINPLGYWTGGIDVDSGATNRKLGSDMGDAITGGGLHGKDLSKADVSLNIYAHLLAQERGEVVEFYCAIGDRYIDGKPYEEIVELAKEYIKSIGGFEEFAKWGLIRPTN